MPGQANSGPTQSGPAKPGSKRPNLRMPNITMPPALLRFFRKARRWLGRARKAAPGWLTSYVSPLGWCVLALGVASLAAFPALGWHELLVIAVIALVMEAAGLVMSLGNTSFKATLGLSESRITVGESVDVDVEVANPGKVPTVSATGELPLGEARKTFRIPALAPGKSKRQQVRFRAATRAVLPVGPLSIRKGDPFGLIRHEQSLSETIDVYIHPRTVRLSTLSSGLARDLEGGPTEQVVDDDLDFYGLREYRPGDDMRNVHWLSSAKTGTLMIRQYDATKRTDTSLTLACNPAAYPGEREFETAVSVAASIGAQCLVDDRPLVCRASTRESRATHPTRFLDWCSGITPDADEDPNLASATLEGSPNASFYFFVTGSLADFEALRRVAATMPGESVCVIFQVDPSQDVSIRRYDGFTLASVDQLENLPLVMEALR